MVSVPAPLAPQLQVKHERDPVAIDGTAGDQHLASGFGQASSGATNPSAVNPKPLTT